MRIAKAWCIAVISHGRDISPFCIPNCVLDNESKLSKYWIWTRGRADTHHDISISCRAHKYSERKRWVRELQKKDHVAIYWCNWNIYMHLSLVTLNPYKMLFLHWWWLLDGCILFKAVSSHSSVTFINFLLFTSIIRGPQCTKML